MTAHSRRVCAPAYDPATPRRMRGKVRARRDGRLYLDFWPDVKGTGRLLWSDRGAGFRDEEHAQWVGEEIHRLEASGTPLVDAIGAFRSARSRPNRVGVKLAEYGERLGSVLPRGAPRCNDLMHQACRKSRLATVFRCYGGSTDGEHRNGERI